LPVRKQNRLKDYDYGSNGVYFITICTKYRTPTLSNVVRQFKSFVTKRIGVSIWQKSFYDHIVRNERDYREIWNYIDSNPNEWFKDELYIKK